jgi:hypothetical protein
VSVYQKLNPTATILTATVSAAALLSTFCCALLLTANRKENLVMSNIARIVFDFIKKGLHGCNKEYRIKICSARKKNVYIISSFPLHLQNSEYSHPAMD